jgi:hypothetical protein
MPKLGMQKNSTLKAVQRKQEDKSTRAQGNAQVQIRQFE